MKFPQKTWHIIIAVWVVLSTVYIVNDQWQDFKQGELKTAYQQGVADSVLSLLKESEKCAPISVYAQDQEVKLIPIECLKEAETE